MAAPLSSDEALVNGCLEGKKESWDLFVERFSKLIHWSIRRALENTPFHGRTGIGEEIFQEVFERLIEKEELSKLREIKRLRKYLAVAACHSALDKVKHLSRAEEKLVSTETAAGDSSADSAAPAVIDAPLEHPEDEALRKEREAVVESALDALSPKERACVEFHYMDGKTHREIGEILGVPQDTVSTIIRRTKEKLKILFLEKGLEGRYG